MKKRLIRFLSYVLVAALASAATLALTPRELSPEMMKLIQLDALIQEKFIGEADATAMADGAAAGMIASLGDRWSHYIPAAEYRSFEQG